MLGGGPFTRKRFACDRWARVGPHHLFVPCLRFMVPVAVPYRSPKPMSRAEKKLHFTAEVNKLFCIILAVKASCCFSYTVGQSQKEGGFKWGKRRDVDFSRFNSVVTAGSGRGIGGPPSPFYIYHYCLCSQVLIILLEQVLDALSLFLILFSIIYNNFWLIYKMILQTSEFLNLLLSKETIYISVKSKNIYFTFFSIIESFYVTRVR